MITYIKSRQSLTVLHKGVTFTVAADTQQYQRLLDAINDNDVEAVEKIVYAVEDIRHKLGDVEVFGGHVKFRGEPLHNYLVDRILETNDVEPLGHFLDNVMRNPSRRAVQDLYKWCEAGGLPITRDGCIVAYKLVRNDFKDIYSGTFDNSVGAVVEVPRNMVDEDPNRTCSAGLHFCSQDYLPNYGGSDSRCVLVKVNPADVVAFPTDYNLSKARCCRYEVIEEIERETAAEHFDDHEGYYVERRILDRIESIESELELEGNGTLVERLDAIDEELGLPHIEPLIARIDRAESQLGLS
jgi:hypothetical protein